MVLNILETPAMVVWKFSLHTDNKLEPVPQEGFIQQKRIEVLGMIKAR
jgi:hypothetical protein